MTGEEIMKNIEDLKQKVHEADAKTLIQAYKYYHRNFNPLSYTSCEVFSEIKKEISKRLERLDEIERK